MRNSPMRSSLPSCGGRKSIARNGMRIDQAGIYVTASPCWGCFRLIANAGIVRIVFGEFYRDNRIFDVAKQLNIELHHLPLANQPTK